MQYHRNAFLVFLILRAKESLLFGQEVHCLGTNKSTMTLMGCKKYFIIFMFFIQNISSFPAFAGKNDSLFYQVGFKQELNAYQWLSQIFYERPIFGKGVLRIGESFNSSLIRLSRNDRKWKDDQQLNLNLFLPYSKIWGVNFAASANKFSDRLSGIVSDIKTNWSTIGFRLQPRSKIELRSSIGYKYDDRQARIDRGITHNVHFKADSLIIKNYENQFFFLSRGDNYSIRKNTDFELKYQVRKYFQQDAFDSLYVFWTKQRRDNYDISNSDGFNIESLAQENRGFHHFLIYGSPIGIQFRFRTLLNSRVTGVDRYNQDNIDESRSKKDFHSENEIGMLLQRNYMALNFSLSYETDDQKNEIPDSLKAKRFSKRFYYISPDFKSSRLTVSARSNFYLFRSDTLQLSSSISRYRYDTPENNVDDRDEFRWNFMVAEIHNFSPYLKLISNGSVTLNHLVYIYGERSANNNWMRIFRLFPQLVYRPNNKFSITHDLEVYANYVDYDFEFGTSSTDLKSYVFRRFSFTQEIITRMTKRTSIFFSAKIELEENGKLDWDQWTEFLLMSRETYWLRANLTFQAQQHLFISPGICFSKRAEKKQSYLSFPGEFGGTDGTIVSYGPTLKLIYSPHEKMNLSFEGMRRVVTTNSVRKNFFNQFNLLLTWYN